VSGQNASALPVLAPCHCGQPVVLVLSSGIRLCATAVHFIGEAERADDRVTMLAALRYETNGGAL